MSEEFKVIISAEIAKLKENINKGKEEIQKFAKDSKENFKAFEEDMNKAGEVSGRVMKTIGTAVAGTVTALLALTASTEQYRENQAKLNTAFESAGASANTAKAVYNDLYRVLGDDDRAVEASNHLAQLTTSQEALTEWTTICQGVYATFGDSLPIEGLTEASNETAKVGTVTGVLADALNWAGVSEEAFNEKLEACNTEAEREKLIRETLTGIYKDTAELYEENASGVLEQHEAQLKFNESTARIGEALAPVNAMLTELGAEILEKIAPHIEAFINEHGDELEASLTAIAEALGSAIGWIADNWEIISTLAVVIIAISGAIATINAVITIYNAVMLIANSQTLLIISIIVLVAAAIALLVIYWDDICNAMKKFGEVVSQVFGNLGEWFKGIADKIMNAFQNIGSWFSTKFTEAKTSIVNAFQSIPSWFKSKYTEVTNIFQNIGSWFGSKFKGAMTSIKNAFSDLPGFFKGILNSIQDLFKNVGTTISEGLTKAVKGAVNWVLEKAVDTINAVISAINGAIKFINMIPNVNIGYINELTAPKLAKGGVVDSATLAVIGEQGKEAVVPLENNTEWINKLAEKINTATGSGSQKIVLQVDGKTFGEIACNSINSLTRQTGKLNLVMG